MFRHMKSIVSSQGIKVQNFLVFLLRNHPNVIIAADKEEILVLEYKIDTRMSIKI